MALYSNVATGLAMGKLVVVDLLDIKSAYDNVLIPEVYECLSHFHVPKDLAHIIIPFLRDRQV